MRGAAGPRAPESAPFKMVNCLYLAGVVVVPVEPSSVLNGCSWYSCSTFFFKDCEPFWDRGAFSNLFVLCKLIWELLFVENNMYIFVIICSNNNPCYGNGKYCSEKLAGGKKREGKSNCL